MRVRMKAGWSCLGLSPTPIAVTRLSSRLNQVKRCLSASDVSNRYVVKAMGSHWKCPANRHTFDFIAELVKICQMK
jgi:hypothetical protein